MDSPQPIPSSPLKTSPVFPKTKTQTYAKQSQENNLKQTKSTQVDDPSLGALEVYIDQARDIHNICIYQNQDVYAKLSLTSNPENTLSTKTINGGGRNPIFDETIRLTVPKVDSALKCEIWMLSRVRNYLEDQLLGFAIVPLSEILLSEGRLEKEFSLSSTDLFHSPAGFVQLSVSYLGTKPEVIPVEAEQRLLVSETASPCDDLGRVEFPDPRVVNEDQCMAEEYFAMPRFPSLEPDNSPENLIACADNVEDDHNKCSVSPLTENGCSNNGGNVKGPAVWPGESSKVVEKDIVDMYVKSMQQFTESLAKMKLPMDVMGSSEPAGSGLKGGGSSKNSGSSPGPRVFYGSRAFF